MKERPDRKTGKFTRIAWRFAAIICTVFLAIWAIIILKDGGKPHIYVIGLDGADWDILDPLIKQGKLPVFKKIKENSAWARLRTFEPTLSAVIWTSIATGKNMLKHGIVDWTFVNQQNIQVPYSNSRKRTPSIWEIMDENDRRSVVLGWFVTDPPDNIDGVMVSDSFAPALSRYFSREKNSWNFANSVHPESEFKGLLRYFNQVRQEGAFEYARLVNEMNIPDYLRTYRERYSNDPGKVPVLKLWNAFLFYNRVEDLLVDRFLKTADYDIFLAYYRLPDVFLHFATLFLEKEYHDRLDSMIVGREPSPENLSEFNRKMADLALPLLKDKEALLEKIYNKAVQENAYLLIVSDHGFRLSSRGYCHYGLPPGVLPPDGILMLTGPDSKHNSEINASVYDITPTILYLSNLPVGSDMDGRPLIDALKSKRQFKTKMYTKMKHLPDQESQKRNHETIDELKSLNYIH